MCVHVMCMRCACVYVHVCEYLHISSSSYHSDRNVYVPGWWTVSMAH